MVLKTAKQNINEKVLDILLNLSQLQGIDEILNRLATELGQLFGISKAYFSQNENIPDKFSVMENGFSSSAYLPIIIRNHICGALVFEENTYPRKWTEEEKHLLERVSGFVSSLVTKEQQLSDLQAANSKLLEQDIARTQILSTVSHELRTPLANILGFSELLLHRNFNPDQVKQYIGEIHNSSLRLSNLINDFLDLAKLENAGHLQLSEAEPVEIDYLAESAWRIVNSPRHMVEWQIAKNLPEIVVDHDAITRVFTNLFSNAVKYSPIEANASIDRSKIICTIRRTQSEIIIGIKDHGIGMAEEHQDKVFEKFYRVDSSYTRKIGGTGLGLWISKEIVEAHKGKIWFESKLNKGTSFYISLPINL